MDTKEHEIHRGAGHGQDWPEQEHAFVAGLDRRRLLALAGAIREHEARVRRQSTSPRAHDLALYRRLRQIGGSL